MTKLRKKNGREKPWNVKYWSAGNETWGCGWKICALNTMRTSIVNMPLICVPLVFIKLPAEPIPRITTWTDVLMREASRNMNGISLHYYTVPRVWNKKGSATQFNDSLWFVTLQKTLKMDELVTMHSEVMDKYDPSKKVGLLVDEWGTWYDVEPGTNPGFLYQQNTLRDALVAGINLNIFNNHSDRVRMSNIAQMINVLQSVILTKEKEIVLTPTYYVFKMYSVHQECNNVTH